jgi:hypothetical protein
LLLYSPSKLSVFIPTQEKYGSSSVLNSQT